MSEALTEPKPEDVLGYIKESNEHMLALSEENKALKAKVAQLESDKVTLQKVASAPAFGPKEVEQIMEAVRPSQFVAPDQETKVASILTSDPLHIIELFKKMAHAIEPRTHGRGVTVEDENPQETADDPDGWNKLAAAYPS